MAGAPVARVFGGPATVAETAFASGRPPVVQIAPAVLAVRRRHERHRRLPRAGGAHAHRHDAVLAGGRALRVRDRGVDLAHSAGEVAGRLGLDVRLPADIGLIGQFRIVLGALVLPGSVKTKMFLQPARPPLGRHPVPARGVAVSRRAPRHHGPSTTWVTGVR